MIKYPTMKHPFKVGDLVRSAKHPTNLAIVTKVSEISLADFFVNVKWLNGVHAVGLPVYRFTLASRVEQ